MAGVERGVGGPRFWRGWSLPGLGPTRTAVAAGISLRRAQTQDPVKQASLDIETAQLVPANELYVAGKGTAESDW